MQVILLDKVPNLGNLGDVVKVKDGYARNFLIPTGRARRATEAAIKEFADRRAELEKAAAEKLAAEKAVKEQANEEKSGSQAAGAAKAEPKAHAQSKTASKAAVLPKNNTATRRTKKKKS